MTQDASNAQNVTLVLVRITAWNHDTHTESQFLWIYGPASAGKTVIAGTIAKICHAKLGRMAGGFFFNRHACGRNDETLIVSTLVYQLTQCSPEFRRRISKAIEKNKIFLSRPLEVQILALAVRPPNS